MMSDNDGDIRSQWLPTRNAKYGVVIHDFATEKPYPFLKIRFGDVVQILEENSGWYRGFALRDKTNKGIFPTSHVFIKDCNVVNPGPSESVVSKDDPMVQEITDVLREWCDIWKRLYSEGKRQQFQELTQLMKELLDRRRQIMSKTLPRDELRELKQKVAHKIDSGNRFVNLDMIPREDTGEVINPKSSGVMKLFKAMRTMSQLNAETVAPTASHVPGQLKVSRAALPPTAPKKEEHHLFLKFSALALPVNEPCDLLFFLYDGKLNKVLSERYMISLSQQCLPKNPDKIGQCFAVFTDLDSSDVQNKDLYLACQVIRVGNELDGHKTSAPLRKPHGAGVFPIHELLNTKDPMQEEQEPQVDIFLCPFSEYHRLLENIIKKQGVYHQTEKGTGVFVGVRVLRGPLSKVKEENPLLFRKFTAIIKKLSFAEIIRPYDERHDVYLTLLQGVFSKGSKRADKNVEVVVEMLGDDDNTLTTKCIKPGIGEDNVSVYTSLVHYHLATPIFNETIKIEIHPDDMKTTRVRFSFYHKSTVISSKIGKTEPFAMAHLRLMKKDETTIADGQHELYVYSYKDLAKHPHRLATLPDVATGSLSCPQEYLHLRDSFSIVTHICSTKLTQDASLHGLLYWYTDANQKRLPEILRNLQSVSGNEIVKFLTDTFNALFAIIEEKGEVYGDPVFEALVFIIGLLVVERYENFRPVLDTYCEQHFSAATIHFFLVKKMKYVFEQVMVMDNAKRKLDQQKIFKTMKAAEFLFKFIMRSRYLYDQATQGKGNEQFIHNLQDLLRTACSMMSKDCPEGELVAPKAQAQAMQFFPQIFNLLLTSITVKSLAKIVAEFLMSIKETKLRVYKSVFLASIVSSELFTTKESRAIVLPTILRHIRFHISQRDEAILRDDSLEKSLEIMGSILTHLHGLPTVQRDDGVRVLVKEMLTPLLECFSDLSNVKDRQHPQLGLCVSNIMGLFELMTPEHYRWLRSTFEIKEDLEEFVLTSFYTYSEVIKLTQLHPPEWSLLRFLHNSVMLGSISEIAKILAEEYLGDTDGTTSIYFNSNLWERYFLLCVDFCCQSPLQLEGMSELKRNRILDLYGDMRVTMNTRMLERWKALGNFQARFVPGMVGPFLKISLLHHTGLRRSTIPAFFDMMEYEWKYNKNFHRMEIEMIDKLDLYVSGGMGDPAYRKTLQQMLADKCKGHPMAEGGGTKFIESLAELLKRLLDYREVHRGDEYRDLHMHVVYNLLNFYKSIGREEIYLRYIYRLAELHKASNNWVEAAFTLLLHAELLQWSPTMLKPEGPYPRQSAAERKMALYDDIISYFDKGKLWESGIQHCKEIASQLDSVTFDYEKLSEIHKTISRFYSSILHEVRAEPIFFRVGFYGGFPSFIKNKVFIYRGMEFEKLADFNSRISSTYPIAKFLTSLEPPGLDILESEEQYIQCCSVEPLPEPSILKRFEGKQVKEEISRFYHTNNVKQFVLKRPFHVGKKDKSNEFKTLHIERTVYTTEYQFPGILRWFPITDTEVTVLNPVQNGAELILDNISQLKTLINRYRSDRQNTSPLTMKLNGTLDAAVSGGVANFDSFFTYEFLSEHPECKADIPRLRNLMEELGRTLTDGVALHAEVCPDTMRKLHERMEELLKEYLSKYGDLRQDDAAYDPATFLAVDSPENQMRKRRLSSSRRKELRGRPSSGNYERSQTVSTAPGTTPIIERHLSEQAPPPVPEHRNRSHTEGGVLNSSPPSLRKVDPSSSTQDYDEPAPPKLPTKQRRGSITQPGTSSGVSGHHGTPPPSQLNQVQNTETPPAVPLRKANSRTPSGSPNQSRPTSFTSSGEVIDDGPRPPPRVASVRGLGMGKSKSIQLHGSKESLDRAETNSPAVSPSHQKEDPDGFLSVKNQEKKTPTPPPVPRKMHKQHSLQLLKNGASTNDSNT